MRILITNDDGIDSYGLKELVSIAKNYGEVMVVAPSSEQSCMSQSRNLRRKIEYKKVDVFDDIVTYTIDSTPTDCVCFAYYGLKYDFDIVFSGVNKGLNLGHDILYSGTCAAVFEAGGLGKKGISFSCHRSSFDGIKYIKETIDYIFNNLIDKANLFNVNLPNVSKGIKITRQGGINFSTEFKLDNLDHGLTYTYGDDITSCDSDKLYLDTACVMNNYISITPMTNDRTDIEIYNKLTNK